MPEKKSFPAEHFFAIASYVVAIALIITGIVTIGDTVDTYDPSENKEITISIVLMMIAKFAVLILFSVLCIYAIIKSRRNNIYDTQGELKNVFVISNAIILAFSFDSFVMSADIVRLSSSTFAVSIFVGTLLAFITSLVAVSRTIYRGNRLKVKS